MSPAVIAIRRTFSCACAAAGTSAPQASAMVNDSKVGLMKFMPVRSSTRVERGLNGFGFSCFAAAGCSSWHDKYDACTLRGMPEMSLHRRMRHRGIAPDDRCDDVVVFFKGFVQANGIREGKTLAQADAVLERSRDLRENLVA